MIVSLDLESDDALRDRIYELEEEIENLERAVRQERDAREEAEMDFADLEACSLPVENVQALREWLDRRTGELKWLEWEGGDSEHLRDLRAVLSLLDNDAGVEVLPL